MRPRKSNPLGLPPCMYPKHGRFWLVKKGKWTDLGTDRVQAITRYGELTTPRKDGPMVSLIERYFRYHTTHVSQKTGRQLSKRTIDHYASAKKDLIKAFRSFSPEQIKSKHIAKLRMDHADQPAKANRNQLLLKIILNYALEEGLIEFNPAVGASRLKTLARDRYITDKEFSAIYEKAGPRLRVIMKLCFLTGQRIGDVLKIKFEDLKEDGIYFKQEKTAEELTIQYTPWLLKTLDEARGLLTDGKVALIQKGYLLRGERAGSRHSRPAYQTIQQQWAKACSEAGIENATLHDLRAKAATDGQKQGFNPTALLGHASEKQTERYLRDKTVPLVQGPGFRQQLDN